MHHNTTVDWNNYMREVVIEACEEEGTLGKIGGKHRIVEVDESQFTKRKNNVGRLTPATWVVGGICRETNQSFVEVVPNRTLPVIMAVIKRHVARGSTVYTDCFASYQTSVLQAAGFDHFTVNHKYNFVNPFTGVHTQNIERMWGDSKMAKQSP